MRIFRLFISFLAVGCIAAISFRSEMLSNYSLEALGFGWMNSYLFPRLLLILFTSVLIAAIFPSLKLPKVRKTVVGVLIGVVCVGGYLAINPPYVNDWFRTGTDMLGVADENPIGNFLNRETNFDGLVCLALPDCPYCVEAIPNLEMLQERNPNVEIVVFVFAKDSTGVQSFNRHIGETDIPIYLVPSPKESIELCGGQFPTYLYFRNGKIIHRWFNSEFGYPALDWIESGLQ